MAQTAVHREEVKAILRMRFGSIEKFAAARGVKSQAVRDVLRGKARGAINEVAAEIGIAPDQLEISQLPVCGTDSKPKAPAHRLNRDAK